MTPIYCTGCGNKVGIRRGDGVIVVRWKGRTVEFEAGNVTCESCATVNALDRLGITVVA